MQKLHMHRHGLHLVVTRGHVNKIHVDLVSSSNPDLPWLWAAALPSLPLFTLQREETSLCPFAISEVRSRLMYNVL